MTPETPPVPPDALKPWYYQGWFIVPTFVWWPCSAILFIRSPWHNGVVGGALSWAWIIIGGGWIFHADCKAGCSNDAGRCSTRPCWWWWLRALLLTVLTQSLWLLRDRPRIRRIRDAGGFADYADTDAGARAAPSRPAASARRRRHRGHARNRRRRR